MKQVLTVSCKLQVTPEQSAKIDGTITAFAAACEYVNQTVQPTLMNELAIQSLVYHDVRARFGLSAQLAIHAIRRVSGNRKTAKKDGKPVGSFAPTSATYDARTFSFREKDWTVSLTTIDGRERFPLAIGNYQIGLLKGQKPKTATLCKRKDGTYYLNIQLESTPPEPEKTSKVLGCDLGRTDIVVTSEGDKFSGKEITRIRECYAKLRANIQQKAHGIALRSPQRAFQQAATRGTRSTRRRCRELLKRLSGKERRFQELVNHTISHRLITRAKSSKQAIALEDLTGIRERTNQLPRTKKERRLSNSWAFFQLRQFLIYKAIKHGVHLLFVNPRYTSQTCHNCNHIHPQYPAKSYRAGKRFVCGHCGWNGDADYNGSKNIATLGVPVDAPEGSRLFCSLQDHLRAVESPTLAHERVA
jgi:putative transposase